MASQLGSLQFISEGSTRRKEILAKFLDLEMFEKKYKMAKEDASDLRGALKRLEGKEFDEDISSTEKHIASNEKEMEVHVEKCESLKVELTNFTTELNDLIKKIDSIPTEIINITEITGQLSTKEKEIANLIAHNIQLNEELFSNKEVLVKITNFVSEFDVTEVQKNKNILIEKQERLNQLVAIQ